MQKFVTEYIILAILIFLFLFGITLILKSDSWNMGSIESMNLAGSIISILSGIGLLIKLNKSK
jgi:hypothetical protein